MKILLSISLLFILNSANAYQNVNQQTQAQIAIYKSIFRINQFSINNYPQQVMHKFITNEILPLFDFNHMSTQILQNIPANFKHPRLINRIKSDIADTIVQSLFKAKGKIFIPTGVRKVGNNIILQLRVRNINIDLAMHQTKNGWKIFDIAMKNQSLLAYYKRLISRR